MTLKGFCKRFVRVCFWFDNTFCLSILNLAKHLVESKRILFANRTIGRSGRQHVIRLRNVGLFCIEVAPIEEAHFLIQEHRGFIKKSRSNLGTEIGCGRERRRSDCG